MLVFEWLLVVTSLLYLLSDRIGQAKPEFSTRHLFLAASVLFAAHIIFEGVRWQLLPIYLALVGAALAQIRTKQFVIWLRATGYFFYSILIVIGLLLGNIFPIKAIPGPAGPYAVGTFHSELIDDSRVERYEPEFNRGVSVQVWYPVNSDAELDSHSKQTLFHELYSGEYDLVSFLFGYMKKIETNSYIDAPIANSSTFPLIIFNHGLFIMVDQSIQLMEHLASNGYIVASISHPFESLKVGLSDRGTRTFSMLYPEDVGFTNEDIDDGGIGNKIGTISGKAHSDLMEVMYPLFDSYNAAQTKEERTRIVEEAQLLGSLQVLQPLLTADNLTDFIKWRSLVRNRSTSYWVEDTQFVVDKISEIETEVARFSEALDKLALGVIGFSYGGAATGEFCKIDARCKAGINLDGTQFGPNWNKPTIAPFLLINSDTNLRGNDYAYYPAPSNFYDIHIPNTEHPDYVDALTVFPILRLLGLSGDLEYQELADLVNDLSLAFLDEYLKTQTGRFSEQMRIKSESVLRLN
jgi:hypothetical protein